MITILLVKEITYILTYFYSIRVKGPHIWNTVFLFHFVLPSLFPIIKVNSRLVFVTLVFLPSFNYLLCMYYAYLYISQVSFLSYYVRCFFLAKYVQNNIIVN